MPIDLPMTCLEESRLQALLEGQLGADDADEASTHIEACPDCQSRLDALTSPTSNGALTSSQRRIWNRVFSDERAGSDDTRADRSDFATLDARTEVAVQARANCDEGMPELPGYEVVEAIGRGGMGTVYRGRHLKLDRDVAIKILRSNGCGRVSARIDREMIAAGKLQHANIVQTYDAGESDGVAWIVMELLDGQHPGQTHPPSGSTNGVVDSHRQLMPVATACDYIRQAAIGLQAAHDAGLVHRDVKPSNLMVTSDGIVKLLDLGLVSMDATEIADGEITDETTIMGSLDYIAPEQGRDTRAADARSDIYSLGCTLYALLTGRAPFAGAAFNTAQKKLLAHACEPRPDVRDTRDDVPPELSELIRCLMNVDPCKRPATAGDVADRLQPFCGRGSDGTGIRGMPAGGARKPLAAALGGLIALLGIVIIIRFKDGTEKRIEVDKPVDLVTLEGVTDVATVRVQATEPSLGSDWPNEAPAFAVLPFDAEQATAQQKAWAEHLSVDVETKNTIGVTLRMVPPGEFQMGSTQEFVDNVLKTWPTVISRPPGDVIRKTLRGQAQRHKVRLTNALYMAVHPVTVGQYRDVTGDDRSDATRRKYPAMPESVDPATCPVRVFWKKAIRFCNELSVLENLAPYYRVDDSDAVTRLGGPGYRLPTEAEWEFACRSGSDAPFWTDGIRRDVEHYAWFRPTHDDKTYYLHPVGLKAPNGFGLHDMLGGTAEWCYDRFDRDWYAHSPVDDPAGPAAGDRRAWRSGGDYALGFRISAATRGAGQSNRSVGGIRLVRTIQP